MSKKPKWQLDFEVGLSLLSNEDLLSRWGDLEYDAEYASSLSETWKKCDLAYKEILRRMSFYQKKD